MTNEQIKDFTLRTSQANHSELMLILCDVEQIYLEDAKKSYIDGDIKEYLRYIELAKKAHNELMNCINPMDAQGKNVLIIMRFVYKQLITSGVKREPVELDKCMEIMATMRVCFEKLHEIDTEGPVMKNTHQVYAGLTYGKGTLNESVQGTDYSKRGFKA